MRTGGGTAAASEHEGTRGEALLGTEGLGTEGVATWDTERRPRSSTSGRGEASSTASAAGGMSAAREEEMEDVRVSARTGQKAEATTSSKMV